MDNDDFLRMELKCDNKNEMTEEAMVRLIDEMMAGGVSRLKIREGENMDRDSLLKEYHHGRCDIGSPWAKGTAFDVLE